MSQNHWSFNGEDFKEGTKHRTSIGMGSKFRGKRSEELCKALPAHCHLITLGVISRVSPGGSSQLREAVTQTWTSPVPVGASTTLVFMQLGTSTSGSQRALHCNTVICCSPPRASQLQRSQGETTHLPAILAYLLNKYPGKKRTTSATQKLMSPFSTCIQLLAMKRYKCNLTPTIAAGRV